MSSSSNNKDNLRAAMAIIQDNLHEPEVAAFLQNLVSGRDGRDSVTASPAPGYGCPLSPMREAFASKLEAVQEETAPNEEVVLMADVIPDFREQVLTLRLLIKEEKKHLVDLSTKVNKAQQEKVKAMKEREQRKSALDQAKKEAIKKQQDALEANAKLALEQSKYNSSDMKVKDGRRDEERAREAHTNSEDRVEMLLETVNQYEQVHGKGEDAFSTTTSKGFRLMAQFAWSDALRCDLTHRRHLQRVPMKKLLGAARCFNSYGLKKNPLMENLTKARGIKINTSNESSRSTLVEAFTFLFDLKDGYEDEEKSRPGKRQRSES